MADPNAELDVSLQRLKAYGKLCLEDEGKAEIGNDISRLVAWVEWAKPLLGAANAGEFSFSDVQRRATPKSDE